MEAWFTLLRQVGVLNLARSVEIEGGGRSSGWGMTMLQCRPLGKYQYSVWKCLKNSTILGCYARISLDINEGILLWVTKPHIHHVVRLRLFPRPSSFMWPLTVVPIFYRLASMSFYVPVLEFSAYLPLYLLWYHLYKLGMIYYYYSNINYTTTLHTHIFPWSTSLRYIKFVFFRLQYLIFVTCIIFRNLFTYPRINRIFLIVLTIFQMHSKSKYQ